MTPPIFTSIQEGDTHHMLILGTSDQGKNVLLQAEAMRLGITYEELLRRMEPSAEQKEQQRMRREEDDQAEERLLNAVREAFWSFTPKDHYDFDALHDVLVAADVVEEPTPEQIKAFFMMLPSRYHRVSALVGVQ